MESLCIGRIQTSLEVAFVSVQFTCFICQVTTSNQNACTQQLHNIDWRSSLTSFRVFRCNFASNFFNLLLVRFYQAEMAAAWRSGSERRFYDDHDRKVKGSPPNVVSLLRPWIRCFTMIISAWWSLASSKLRKSEENSSGKLRNKGNF